jgi:hypothetical protein
MRLPASILEELRHSHNVRQLFTKSGVVANDTSLLCSQSGHHATAARIAHWILNIGTLKCRTSRSQSIEIRSLDNLFGELPTEVTQIIDHDKQNIGTISG